MVNKMDIVFSIGGMFWEFFKNVFKIMMMKYGS